MLLEEGPRLISRQRWREFIEVGIFGLLHPDRVVVSCHPCEQSTLCPKHKGALVARVLSLKGGVRTVHDQDRAGMAIELMHLRHGLHVGDRSGTGLIHGITGIKMGILGRPWGGWGWWHRWWGDGWGRRGSLIRELGIGTLVRERWETRRCLVGRGSLIRSSVTCDPSPPDPKNPPPKSPSNTPAPRRRFFRQNIRTL